ncbi:Mce associated membrane protein, partial [Mycobacterium rhizamassiliense]
VIRLKSRQASDHKDSDAAAETLAGAVPTAVAEDLTADDEIAEDVTKVGEALSLEVDAPDGETATVIDEPDCDEPLAKGRRRISWSRVVAYGILPGLAMLLACAAGYVKWQEASVRGAQAARAESVRAATDGTIALLSYRPDTVQKDLEAARARLTGTFLNAYTQLTHDVVIPGAKQKQISAVATVPGAASTSATASHAVVLLFVNQTIIVGQDAPTNSASSVRVTLDKINGHWLISQFDPV